MQIVKAALHLNREIMCRSGVPFSGESQIVQ